MRETGSGTRQLVAEFLADHDLRPQTLTLGSNGAIKEAVRLGLGVSLAVARRGRARARQRARSPRSACAAGCRDGSGTRCTRRPCRRGPRSSCSSTFANGPEARAGVRGPRVSAAPIPRGEIAPSLLACDFSRLGRAGRARDGRRRARDPRRRDGRALRPADHDRAADRRVDPRPRPRAAAGSSTAT